MARPTGLRPKCGHSALLVVYLELPNFTPRALTDRIWTSSDAFSICVNRP